MDVQQRKALGLAMKILVKERRKYTQFKIMFTQGFENERPGAEMFDDIDRAIAIIEGMLRQRSLGI